VKIVSLISLFLFPLAAFAQGRWSGEVNLDGGTNFNWSPMHQKTHNLGDISAKIGYDAEKFSFEISGSGSYHHVQVGQVGRDFEMDESGIIESSAKKIDSSIKQKTNTKAFAGASLSWTPDSLNTIEAYYRYNYSLKTPNTYTFSSQDVGENMIDFSVSSDKEHNMEGVHSAGASYMHLFNKPGRTLSAELGFEFGHLQDFAEWTTCEGTAEKPEDLTDIQAIVEKLKAGVKDSLKYRIEPYSDNMVFSVNALFSEPDFVGVKNLKLDFALGYRLRNLEDHSRASTFVKGEWKDSVSYRENFNFRTVTLSPSVRVRYSAGIYKLDLTYTPEYYAQKLDSDEKIGDINVGSVAHLVDMTNVFEPWMGHRFVLSLNRTESRPDYLQVCWFLRDGQYSNEKYRGNPDLKNSITTQANFLYSYSYRRFSVSLNSTYTYEPRMIAKTYDYEIINDQECRVYTWINGGNSHEFNQDLSLSWTGKHFRAGVSGRYTFYRGFSHTGNLTESSDYSIRADLGYRFKTWMFELNGGYQSEIERSYSKMTVVPDCEARISKTFGKHINVFLQGRSILDTEVSIITESEDKTEYREEKIRYNNRLFVLGFSYKF